MEDFRKVSVFKLYYLLKNLSIGLLALVIGMALSKLLPDYLSPIITLVLAAFLYQYIVSEQRARKGACLVVPYAVFICLIIYTFITIILNILFAWNVLVLPKEFVFLNSPFIPSLLMMPLCFVITLVMNLRGKKLKFCVNCRLKNGDTMARGRTGAIISYEAIFQLRNLVFLFGVVTAIIWTYYQVFYININSNSRDWYMFTWLVVILFLMDEFYFIFRYYNLYLDLKETDSLFAVDPNEVGYFSKSYIRIYVICGNDLYVDTHALDPSEPDHDVIDTPFFFQRDQAHVPESELLRYIHEKTGVDNGELRFFFGRDYKDAVNHHIYRYFYFLDGKKEEYSRLATKGQWMDFKQITRLYSLSPSKLSRIFVADITRMATIILTEKVYDSEGIRKSKIKTYKPTFNLVDVRRSILDFQDDKWMRIAMFNSDVRFFHVRNFLRRLSGRNRYKSI